LSALSETLADMAGSDRNNLRIQAAVLLERLQGKDKLALPKALAADVKDAIAELTPLAVAASATDAAEAGRDSALEAVGEADAVLDVSLDALARALVGAGLSPTKSPFAGFSKHAPTNLKKLAYAVEVNAASDLVAAVAKKSPPAEVKKAASAVSKNAATVSARLKGMTGPEAKYVKARTARDGKLADAARAIARFKIKAKAALVDEPETLAALFARPSAVQAPVKKRAKKKAPSPAPPSPPSSPLPSQPTPPSQVTADARRLAKK
jgi:hypothetical protein